MVRFRDGGGIGLDVCFEPSGADGIDDVRGFGCEPEGQGQKGAVIVRADGDGGADVISPDYSKMLFASCADEGRCHHGQVGTGASWPFHFANGIFVAALSAMSAWQVVTGDASVVLSAK